MKSKQVSITQLSELESKCTELAAVNAQLVLVFGGLKFWKDKSAGKAIKNIFKDSIVMGCSTAGEISNNGVTDEEMVITAIEFTNSQMKLVKTNIDGIDDSHNSGKRIGEELPSENLTSIFLLGQGVNINGSALLDGLVKSIGKDIAITGGLAGDEGNFRQTFTLCEDEISDRNILALGIYNNSVKISHGSMGGWQPFGPVRMITKSTGNILYELDGEPALDVYKKYLGEKSKDLPGAGLLYPFAILNDNQDETGVIRTILGINEELGSLILAGAVDESGSLRLMHASNDGLVKGASIAAQNSVKLLNEDLCDGAVAVLVSCVGRKLVLGSDADDEIEAVQEVLGDTTVTGFYSNGEICPHLGATNCKLHNQTMTITLFSE